MPPWRRISSIISATVREFAKDHPEGKYILGTGTHAVAVIDGDYIDTWDSGDEVPIYYFQEERK